VYERTFVMIKPDGVKRKLVGEIIGRIEKKGYQITDIRMFTLSGQIASEHYAEHQNKPFFPELIEFITSGPVVAMIVEGEDAVKGISNMVGDTDPNNAKPGTIRFDYATSITYNIVHRSDSKERAKKEIRLFFDE